MKKIISLLLVLVLALGLTPGLVLAADSPSPGFIQRVGVLEEAPEGYTEIRTADDLRAVELAPESRYILMEDLRLGDWTPLCADGGFNGQLDGNGHSVTFTVSVTTELPPTVYAGLFARIDSGEVRNLSLHGSVSVHLEGRTSGRIRGSLFVGSVAGALTGNAIVENCVSDMTVSTDDNVYVAIKNYGVGGIVGGVTGGGSAGIDYCRNRGSVTQKNHAGGIVGAVDGSGNCRIFACLNEGSVDGSVGVGGIVGFVGSAGSLSVSSCANTAAITSKEAAGGILGEGYGAVASIIDSLNTGSVTVKNAPGYPGGISGHKRAITIQRCVNTGRLSGVPAGAIAALIESPASIADCYWLDTARSAYGADGSGALGESTAGMLTADALKKEESYAGFDFDTLWTIEKAGELGCAYPLPLLNPEYENMYKVSTRERHNARYEQCLSFFELLSQAGGANGGIDSALFRVYVATSEKEAVNNIWKTIEQINKASKGDFTVDNSFALVLTDLFYQAYGYEAYEEMMFNRILSSFSDAVTFMETGMTVADAKEVQDLLKSLSKDVSSYTAGAGELVNKALGKIDATTVKKIAGKGMKVAGSVYDLVCPVTESVDEVRREISRYTLYNANADTSLAYAGLLGEMNAMVPGLNADASEKQWARGALSSLSAEFRAAAAGNKAALYDQVGGSILNCVTKEGMAAIDVFFGDTLMQELPILAGVRLGLNLGTSLADHLTNMDQIAYNGGMVDCACFLSEALYPVVINRMVEYETSGNYEDLTELKEAMEFYFALQMLAADYGILYYNAIMSPGLRRVLPPLIFDGTVMDEESEATALLAYKADLELTRRSARAILSDTSTVTGYVVSCPVTVYVTDLAGNVVAVQATGSQTVAKGMEDCYHLMGDAGEVKTGIYNEQLQKMWVEGDGDGTMNVTLYHLSGGVMAGYEIYEDLPVSAGSSYTFDGGQAVLDGTETFEPTERYLPPFRDVPEDAYYAEAVAWAVEEGITNGTSKTTFSPNNSCTRAQAVTFLWRAAGSPEPTRTDNPFNDVPSDAYYTKAVLWAVEQGITNGTGKTSFSPSAACTRAQIVTFLWRMHDQPAASASGGFTDVPSYAYYAGAVAWAVEQGITNGMSKTTFAPSSNCTRAHIVTFLWRDLA